VAAGLSASAERGEFLPQGELGASPIGPGAPPFADWQLRFLREVLQVVTEGRLRLCENASHLPVPGIPLAPAMMLDGASLAELRRQIADHAAESGFATERRADLIAAVGEAAMNAVVHGGGGSAQVRRANNTLQIWIEDRGPGIPFEFLHRATLERGFSTVGSLGQGFPLMLQTCDRLFLRTDETGTTVVLEQDQVRAEEEALPTLPRVSDQTPAREGQALDDPGRLASLEATGLMDSERDEDFDRFTRLASRVLNAPVALVSLVDDRRQFFKSAHGLAEPWNGLRQTPLSHSLCQYVVLRGQPFVVENAAEDPQIATNRSIRDMGTVAYAGVPLITREGDILGSFCVMDSRPRKWSDEDMQLLQDLADSITDQVATRLTARDAEKQARLLFLANDAIVVREPTRGTVTFWNPAAEELYGWSASEVLGHPLERFLEAEDPTQRRLVTAGLRRNAHWEGEISLIRRDGTPVVVASRQAMQFDERGRAIAILQIDRDVTKQREAEARLQADLQRQNRIAETLQEALLLTPAADHFEGLLVSSEYEAALEEAEIGGDLVDVFGLSDGRVALVVGDVSGKGLEAAQRTAQIKYALRAFLREDPEPGRALTRLNHFLWEAGLGDPEASISFTVAAVAVLTPESGEASVAVAGAEPPCIVRTSKGRHVEVMDTALSGLPLGIDPNEKYEGIEIYLHPGDRIALMTDGLIEAKGKDDRFGVERLASVLKREGSVRAVNRAALSAAKEFAGGELQDDACLVIAERLGALPTRRLGVPGVNRI